MQNLASVHRNQWELGPGMWAVGPGGELTCCESQLDAWTVSGLWIWGRRWGAWASLWRDHSCCLHTSTTCFGEARVSFSRDKLVSASLRSSGPQSPPVPWYPEEEPLPASQGVWPLGGQSRSVSVCRLLYPWEPLWAPLICCFLKKVQQCWGFRSLRASAWTPGPSACQLKLRLQRRNKAKLLPGEREKNPFQTESQGAGLFNHHLIYSWSGLNLLRVFVKPVPNGIKTLSAHLFYSDLLSASRPSFPEPSPQTMGLRDAFFFVLWRKRIGSEVSDPNSSNTCHVGAFLEIHHNIELREWNEQHCIHVIKLGICLCKLSLNWNINHCTFLGKQEVVSWGHPEWIFGGTDCGDKAGFLVCLRSGVRLSDIQKPGSREAERKPQGGQSTLKWDTAGHLVPWSTVDLPLASNTPDNYLGFQAVPRCLQKCLERLSCSAETAELVRGPGPNVRAGSRHARLHSVLQWCTF